MGWLISLGEIIWGGIQAASTAVVAYLSWAVNALFWLGQVAYNALVDLASVALRGLKAAWGFFHWTYDNILAPAWRKFWKFVDTVRSTLEHVLKPVFDVLRKVRDEVLAIYTKVVRPVLDTIELTRSGLRVLEALHIAWAQKLDAKLGDIEAAIERPFRLVLAKINEVVNLVNRVVTADGLFQRLALVPSLERDAQSLVRIWWNTQIAPNATPEAGLRRAEKLSRIPPAEIRTNLSAFYTDGTGAYADKITELEPIWKVASGDAIGDAVVAP